MGVRLIAIDIDGTLLDSRYEVSAANIAAIQEAAARGIEIVLVTGRRFDFARPVAEQIPCGLSLIVSNGALIKSKDGATHLRHLLPRETARRVLEGTAEFRGGAAVVFDRPRERQMIFERLDWNDPKRKSYFERNRIFMAEVAPLEDCLNEGEDPVQVVFTGGVTAMREARGILQNLPNRWDYALAWTEYEHRDFTILDVIRRGCSKGTTLAEWIRRRGVARQQVMAIGDNFNDREMLELAGLPVVMGNSVPQLKSLGWAVTLSNDHDGVAEAIRNYVLEAAEA